MVFMGVSLEALFCSRWPRCGIGPRFRALSGNVNVVMAFAPAKNAYLRTGKPAFSKTERAAAGVGEAGKPRAVFRAVFQGERWPPPSAALSFVRAAWTLRRNERPARGMESKLGRLAPDHHKAKPGDHGQDARDIGNPDIVLFLGIDMDGADFGDGLGLGPVDVLQDQAADAQDNQNDTKNGDGFHIEPPAIAG
jgi:hypothetical protein